ncbi:MAG TPA: dUTP diphosphatase [Ilumatobacter sp.]
MPLPIDLVRLDPDLPLPAYAHHGDAGLDLFAREEAMIVAAGGRVLMPRSGLALRHGLGIVNAPGLIDSAYRGEIKVVLINTDPSRDYHVSRGDRVAQLVIQRVEGVAWNVVEELDGADRGGGFGHSGV